MDTNDHDAMLVCMTINHKDNLNKDEKLNVFLKDHPYEREVIPTMTAHEAPESTYSSTVAHLCGRRYCKEKTLATSTPSSPHSWSRLHPAISAGQVWKRAQPSRAA